MPQTTEIERRIRQLKQEGDRLYRRYFQTADPYERMAIEGRLSQILEEIQRLRTELELIKAEELTPRLVAALMPAKAPTAAGAQAAKKAKKATPAQLKGLQLKRYHERTEAMLKDIEQREKARKALWAMTLLGSGAAVYHGTTELIGSGRTIQFAKMERETAELIQKGMKEKQEIEKQSMDLSKQWLAYKQQELAYWQAKQYQQPEAAQRGTRGRRGERIYTGAREQWQNWLDAQESARKRQLIEERARWEVFTEQAKAAARNWLNAQQSVRKAWLTDLEGRWEAYNTMLREMMEERRIAAKHIAEMHKLAAETQSKAYLTELTNRLQAWRAMVKEAARAQRELATIRARYRAEMDLEKEKMINAQIKALTNERTQMRRTAAELVKHLKDLVKQGIDVGPLLEEAMELLKAAKRKIEIREVRIMR